VLGEWDVVYIMPGYEGFSEDLRLVLGNRAGFLVLYAQNEQCGSIKYKIKESLKDHNV